MFFPSTFKALLPFSFPKRAKIHQGKIVFVFCFEVSFRKQSPENGNRIPSYYRYSTRSFPWEEFYSVYNFSITIVQKLFTWPFCISFTYFMRIIICCYWKRLIFWTSAALWIYKIIPLPHPGLLIPAELYMATKIPAPWYNIPPQTLRQLPDIRIASRVQSHKYLWISFCLQNNTEAMWLPFSVQQRIVLSIRFHGEFKSFFSSKFIFGKIPYKFLYTHVI